MKITYISHATLLIEVDGINIVTDPWIKGSSYCDQWHLFPKPVRPELIANADYVVYSHGHEDHLHADSLLSINKHAEICYPYSWYGGTTEFFNSLGFKNVKEILNEQTVQLKNNIKITYLANNLDTVIVLDINGKIIVNVNDALPSASPLMIDHFIKKIKKQWPNIDYVFSSYGGASYFPNAVHFSEKNDLEIAETRELFFVTNFCKIIAGLAPTYAIPFATDFILLDDDQRWINGVKFPRGDLKPFFDKYTKGASQVQIIEAYPDDYFLNGTFYKVSPYHQKKLTKSLLDTIDEDYKVEIEAKRNLKKIGQPELTALLDKTKAHILHKQYIIPDNTRNKIHFAIKITDAQLPTFLNVNFRNHETEFSISESPNESLDLLIALKSKTLEYAINNEWGGDAIIIGYGAEVYIYNEDSVNYEYENYCVRLLSRYPNTKEYLKKTPFRALKYLMADTTKRKNLINRLFGNNEKIMEYTDPKLSKRDLWLNKGKCDVCKACNI